MTEMPVVSIVIVSFNCREKLERCLESLPRGAGGVSCEIIVVDNASSDGTMAMVSARFPAAVGIGNRSNAGFASANNQGIHRARGRYVLLLNPDTEVHDGAVAAVARFMDGHPTAWVAGCRLNDVHGALQCSVGAFPSVLQGLLNTSFLYLLFPKTTVVGHGGLRVIDYGVPERVDWVMGAFFMIRHEAITQIGPLDEQFFMYSEEVDFCRRVHDAGFEVWYTPDGVVTHAWGGMHSVSRQSLLWLGASQLLYFRKHHRGAERTALIVLKFAGLALRAAVYACAGSLTLNRELLAKSSYSLSVLRRLLFAPPSATWEAV